MTDQQRKLDKRIGKRNACKLLIKFLRKINKPANRLFMVDHRYPMTLSSYMYVLINMKDMAGRHLQSNKLDWSR